jgi:muramoyltetrapeptide carboxypeptidase
MKVSRRGFGAIAAAGLSVPLSGHAGARSASLPSPVKLIKPSRLRPGDTVGLIAPGGYTSERAIDKALRNIESLGLKVKQGKYLREVFGNYAGSV